MNGNLKRAGSAGLLVTPFGEAGLSNALENGSSPRVWKPFVVNVDFFKKLWIV